MLAPDLLPTIHFRLLCDVGSNLALDLLWWSDRMMETCMLLAGGEEGP